MQLCMCVYVCVCVDFTGPTHCSLGVLFLLALFCKLFSIHQFALPAYRQCYMYSPSLSDLVPSLRYYNLER